jgi:hypothetical protein
MESQSTIKGVLLSLCCLMLLVSAGCEFDVATPGYYDQATQSSTPSITRLVPERATPGVNMITIQGQNFSSALDKNKVYFGNAEVDVLTATPTALVVRRPNMTGTLTVKVVSYDALLVASAPSPYVIDTVLTPFGNFLEGAVETAMAVDKDGHIYVFQDTPPNIYKVTPAGERIKVGTVDKTISDAVTAPDGQVVIFGRSLTIQKFNPADGKVSDWIKLTKQSAYGDFDQYGNLWTGGQNNGDLWCVKTDLTKAASNQYKQGQIAEIRVVNGYVYAAVINVPTAPASAIYRSKIVDATGALEAKELVFDRTQAGVYATATFKDFAVSANGDLYVATNAADPILMVKSGVQDVLYKGIIPTSAEKLMWYGNYLYMLNLANAQGNLYRINIGETGPPYLGVK